MDEFAAFFVVLAINPDGAVVVHFPVGAVSCGACGDGGQVGAWGAAGAVAKAGAEQGVAEGEQTLTEEVAGHEACCSRVGEKERLLLGTIPVIIDNLSLHRNIMVVENDRSISIGVCSCIQTVTFPVDGIVVGTLRLGIRVVSFCLAGSGVELCGKAGCGGVVSVQFHTGVAFNYVPVFVKISGVVEFIAVGASAAGGHVVDIVGIHINRDRERIAVAPPLFSGDPLLCQRAVFELGKLIACTLREAEFKPVPAGGHRHGDIVGGDQIFGVVAAGQHTIFGDEVLCGDRLIDTGDRHLEGAVHSITAATNRTFDFHRRILSIEG